MENLSQAPAQIRRRIWALGLVLQLIVGGLAFYVYHATAVLWWQIAIGFVVAAIMGSYLVGRYAGKLAKLPLAALGEAILHISPGQTGVKAPQFDKLIIGRQYVTALVYDLYQIASLQDNKILAEHRRDATQASEILNHLPLPLFVFNSEQLMTFASNKGLEYCGAPSSELFGKPLFEMLDLEFPTDFTLESWINDCQQGKVIDTAYWNRVRVNSKDADNTLRQCDMAGYYNRQNPTGIEFIVTLFDRTDEYAQDDQSLGFVALAVHELRTPLTLMRGYIELFEDELSGKLDNELTDIMHRMRSSSQQLSAFVNNILNVARIEQNQLEIKLSEENWADILRQAGGDMEVRANSLGKQISYNVAKNLATVAVDRVTIYEVICNLLDNAIKYSGKSTEITVTTTTTKDGLIETLITDRGVGIPTSVIPSLFEKFHRNHRNRAQVSGTGLGLYLSKILVNAHGGDIWVKSKEGEGTTVGFTLKPYAQLADELKSGTNQDDMVRTAHGWIKNHSLYRR